MKVVESFEDIGLRRERWDRLAPTVFQTWDWLSAWWAIHGRGDLIIVTDVDFVLPMFLDRGELYLVGAGNSDYLDVVADDVSAESLGEAIRAALRTTGADGLVWHLLRADSATAEALPAAARIAGLTADEQTWIHAPALRVSGSEIADRKSLRRRTGWFSNNGGLEVMRPHGPAAVAALPDFFDQHIARWDGKAVTSPFAHEAERHLYELLATRRPSWWRMTVLRWNGVTVAQHVGMSFRGRYLWYKPTFERALASRSPGTALLHRLLLDAAAEGCEVFDFGIGEEAFKDRYADQRTRVTTIGMYA